MKRVPLRVLVALLLGAAACSMLGSAAMVSGMTPYLAGVTANSVYVLVECDSTSPVTVQYGLTTSYGSTATTENTEATNMTPVTYVHNVKLTGLQANTTYHYRAGQGGAYSADSTFITACNPGTNVRFACIGDTRSHAAEWGTMTNLISGFNPRFLLIGGDIAESATYSAFKSQFFVANARALMAKCPSVNGPGNHEGWTANTKAFTQGPTASGSTNGYFSFDYGDLHVVVMNTEVAYNVGSAQYNWVRDDLQATTKTWKIVCDHKPAYSGAAHGEDADMIALTNNVFEPEGVDFVFSGHDHVYERNYVDGIYHMVMGSGCMLDTRVYTQKPYTQVKIIGTRIMGIIDMTPTSFHLTSYSITGAVVDEVTKTKGTQTPTPTPPPTPTPTPTPTPAPTPTPTGGGGASQLDPTADAYVYGGATTTNYGTDVDLIVRDGLDTSWDRISYLKFNLSGISGTISAATLKLYCNNLPEGSPVPAKVFSVTNDAWTETGITWSNMPPTVAQLASVSVTATGTWYSFNVTSFVNAQYGGDQVVSLAVVDDTEAKMRVDFNSREESANKPYLEVITEGSTTPTPTPVPTPTPTPVPTPTPTPTPTPIPTPTPTGGGTSQLEPIADSYVISTSTGADSNFGTETGLVVKDGSATSNDRITYLKFDLAGVSGASVTSATLKLYVSELPDGTPVPFKVFSVTDDGWTELGVTWNNRPAAATQLASNSGVSALGWVNLTVTSFVNGQYGGDKIVSLAVLDNTQAALRVKFSSKENATDHPVLEVVTN